MTDAAERIERAAASVLMPGFLGTEPPPWLVRAIEGGLGSVLYFAQNFTGDTARLSAELHRLAPGLLIASDEEGGAVSRLHAGGPARHPSHAELGAADDTGRTRETARALGEELAGVGVDAALSPVVDVNSDPLNPVIGVRAFGDAPELAARHGAAFIEGLQRAGRATAAKHFPGHGDTRTDSHAALPVIDIDAGLLAERELVPFTAAVRAGADMVMSGHIVVPAVDDAPASVSPRWYALLREELGFTGVAITDALDMKGLAHFTGAADPVEGVARGAVAALAAGADLLCLGNPVTAGGTGEEAYRAALEAVAAAVAAGEVPESRLAEASARVAAMAGRVRAGAAPGGL
ncbi:glycoside hydrolase family 3 N-terminal domain-containing protein [Nocardiopsis sp. CNT-189]|uniref:glycoside hydrolase family 3 N-terminal domain-containing protein n=1 Tax=Nocardiopsis oceanisediminis TaxID=2816862 RepID=UPI003B3A2198